MTEEIDESEELEEIEVEVNAESRSEVYDYSGGGSTNSGQLIFPYGVEAFCKLAGAHILRIADKTGEVEMLLDPSAAWVIAGKARGKLASVK